MKYLLIIGLALLGGCSSYNMTLYPRGGGDLVTGTASADRQLKVMLRGEEYEGRAVQAKSSGFGLATKYGSAPTTVVSSGSSNQWTALLTSNSKALRCEFMGDRQGGNGICVDSSEKVYDLLLKPQ